MKILFALRENFPNTEFFLVRIFSHSDWIQREILRISSYSARIREHTDFKKLRIWTLSTQRRSFKVSYITEDQYLKVLLFIFILTVVAVNDVMYSSIYNYIVKNILMKVLKVSLRIKDRNNPER